MALGVGIRDWRRSSYCEVSFSRLRFGAETSSDECAVVRLLTDCLPLALQGQAAVSWQNQAAVAHRLR